MKFNTENFRIWAEKKNILPKFISIVLAFILWGYLTSTKSGEVKFKLPLNYKNLESSFTVSKSSDKYIMVKLRGRKDDLKNINSKNIKLFVDLSAIKEGESSTYPIQVDKTELPEDVTVDLIPDEVRLYAEKKVVKLFSILPRFKGEPERGIVMGKVKISPDNIRLSGPGNVLDSIDAVYTGNIVLNNRNSTFKTMIRLEKVNEGEVEYGFSEVNVTVPLFKESDTTLIEIPLVVRNRKKGFVYDAEYEKVKIRVLVRDGKDIAAQNISAYVDADDFKVAEGDLADDKSVRKEVPVHLKGVASGDVITIVPEKVEVVITRE